MYVHVALRACIQGDANIYMNTRTYSTVSEVPQIVTCLSPATSEPSVGQSAELELKKSYFLEFMINEKQLYFITHLVPLVFLLQSPPAIC